MEAHVGFGKQIDDAFAVERVLDGTGRFDHGGPGELLGLASELDTVDHRSDAGGRTVQW